MKILVRLGADIVVKSDRIRSRFLGRLIANMKQAFLKQEIEATITGQWSRILVETDKPLALDVLSRMYGVSSFSPIEHECSSDFDEMKRTCRAAYKELVQGRTFAIRAKRAGTHPYNSMMLQCELGGEIYEGSAGVRLKNPEVEVHVDVKRDRAMFYSRHYKGPSGLPLGVSGRVLCLMSGGFDSAVSSWLVQKRGLAVDYLFCNLAGAAYERSVLGVTKLLTEQWSHGTRPRFYVLDFNEIAENLRARVKPSHVQVILKRMFYRAAARLAEELGSDAVVTGECVGQVSSQTIQNLRTIELVIDRPVLRPVVTCDKEEIMRLARRIGTFDVCAAIQEYCQLVLDKPVTACKPNSAEREERQVDMALLDKAAEGMRMLSLKDLSEADLVAPYVYVDAIPEGAVVIDCRDVDGYEAWHYEGALHIELHDLMTGFRRLTKAETVYVIYCPYGLQSAVAAEAMQKAGYQAYGLKGGLKSLVKPSHHAYE